MKNRLKKGDVFFSKLAQWVVLTDEDDNTDAECEITWINPILFIGWTIGSKEKWCYEEIEGQFPDWGFGKHPENNVPEPQSLCRSEDQPSLYPLWEHFAHKHSFDMSDEELEAIVKICKNL